MNSVHVFVFAEFSANVDPDELEIQLFAYQDDCLTAYVEWCRYQIDTSDEEFESDDLVSTLFDGELYAAYDAAEVLYSEMGMYADTSIIPIRQ